MQQGQAAMFLVQVQASRLNSQGSFQHQQNPWRESSCSSKYLHYPPPPPQSPSPALPREKVWGIITLEHGRSACVACYVPLPRSPDKTIKTGRCSIWVVRVRISGQLQPSFFFSCARWCTSKYKFCFTLIMSRLLFLHHDELWNDFRRGSSAEKHLSEI